MLTREPFGDLTLLSRGRRRPGTDVLVVVPGRGVPAEQYRWLFDAAPEGWSAAVVDGLYGDRLDDRGGPRAARALADVLARVATDARRYAVAGHSTGARVALRAALDAGGCAGAALLAVIADLADHVTRAAPLLPGYADAVVADLGPVTAGAPYDDRSPIRWVSEVDMPVLLVTGTDDRVCPPYQAHLFADAVRSAGGVATVHEVAGAGHFFERFGFEGDARAEVLGQISTFLSRFASDRRRVA